MNIPQPYSHSPFGLPTGAQVRPSARHLRAFTMVEIALCIAIVAFALVAIMGVLPTGMRVQRDNREDTIINQEGRLWLEAIRGGARGLDELTNYVDLIRITSYQGGASGSQLDFIFGDGFPRGKTNTFTNGMQIVQLLSTPKYTDLMRKGLLSSNVVTAYVRSLTGPASDKPDGAHTTSRDFAFSYQLTSELVPFDPIPPSFTNFLELPSNTPGWVNRSNLMVRAQNLEANALDIRVTLAWPVYPSGATNRVGGNRKTFRALATGKYVLAQVNRLGFLNIGGRGYLESIQPSTYVMATTNAAQSPTP